jgi:ATP-dependent Clp protease ATP-binding subunit ClpA
MIDRRTSTLTGCIESAARTAHGRGAVMIDATDILNATLRAREADAYRLLGALHLQVPTDAVFAPIIDSAKETTAGDVLLTPSAVNLLSEAAVEARQLGDQWTSTMHVLVAYLIRRDTRFPVIEADAVRRCARELPGRTSEP